MGHGNIHAIDHLMDVAPPFFGHRPDFLVKASGLQKFMKIPAVGAATAILLRNRPIIGPAWRAIK
jgi:hypothetical protein